MKRLLLFFIVLAIRLQAQVTFCPPGAKWTARFEQYWMNQQLDHNYAITYIGDSIVSGDTLKMLTYNSFFRYWESEQHPRICFIKQRGDTIFMRNKWTGDQWQILYNFAAQSGQGWANSFYYDSKTCTITVNAVDTVTLNNKNVRRLNVTYQTPPYLPYNGYILEHMGSDDYLFNYRIKLSSDVPEFKEPLCYSDNIIGTIQFGTKLCNYSNGLGISEMNSAQLRIFPNPVNDILNIESDEDALITFKDLSGKILKQEKLSDQKVSTSDLLPGMYFLQIRKSDELVYRTKIVKQ